MTNPPGTLPEKTIAALDRAKKKKKPKREKKRKGEKAKNKERRLKSEKEQRESKKKKPDIKYVPQGGQQGFHRKRRRA